MRVYVLRRITGYTIRYLRCPKCKNIVKNIEPVDTAKR